MRIGSCFSGIGAWEKGFEYLGIDYDLKFFCENDKFPVRCYIAIFDEDESKNLGDITKVNPNNLPDIDVFCYSPPCQAFSIAGKQLGFEDKRGILFFESLKIIHAKKPKYCLMENVKGLTTKKFNAEFKEMLKALEDEGYKNYWKVLNTKDYGLPQNRERVFVISIRNDIEQEFEFPVGFDNGIRLKDILESEVDEKYYIAQEKCDKLIKQFKETGRKTLNINPSGKGMNGIVRNDDIVATVTTNKGEGQKIVIPCITPDIVNKIIRLGNIYPSKGQNGEIYHEDGISPTISSGQGDKGRGIGSNNSPKVMVKEATKKGYAIAHEGDSINMEQPNSKTRRGSVRKQVAQTLTCSCNQAIIQKYRIRKLTPLETWRLQGFKDCDFKKAAKVNSNSQLYKQAGNTVSVNVVMELYKILFSKLCSINM